MFAFLRRSARSFSIRSCNICRICTSASKRKDDFYDVTIVGGGMVGGSLACALGLESSLSELKVLVLEAGPDKHYVLPSKYENRVSSITPGSKSVLESLGAWDHICDMRLKPYKRLHVWDACGDGHIAFDTSQDVSSTTDMAYIIENSVITAALDKQLKQLDQNVEVRYNARIKKIAPPDPVWNMDKPEHNPWAGVELDDGSVIHSRLLVGADGARSTVRGSMDTQYLTWSYGQFGVVATLELGEITENIVAWQKFLPTGPMALLPLSENMSSLVWTTTTDHAKTLVNLPEDAFVDAVNNGFWEDLDRNPLVETVSKIGQAISSLLQPGGTLSDTQIPPSASKVVEGSRAMFPLGLGHSTHYVQHRIALVGDAAHRIHPLAGQGVNLGFGDVASLTDKILQAVDHGQDIGDVAHLQEYETERQRAVVPMIAATDLLNRLFSTSSILPVAARTAGLLATNALTPLLKEQIVTFARK